MLYLRLLVILSLLTGLVLLFRRLLRYNGFRKFAKFILSPLFLIFIVTLFICNHKVMEVGESRVYSDVKQIPYNDVGLLLGVSPTNAPPVFQDRISAAVELYNGGKIKRLIVSGDSSANYDEAKDMKSALVAKGVPDSVIIMDKSGHHTIESVVRCKTYYHCSKVTIISQRFHVIRAIYLASKIGLDAIGYEKGWQWTPPREYISRIKAVLGALN